MRYQKISSLKIINRIFIQPQQTGYHVRGDFKYFSFSPLFGKEILILTHIFEMGGSTTNQVISSTCFESWSSANQTSLGCVPRSRAILRRLAVRIPRRTVFARWFPRQKKVAEPGMLPWDLFFGEWGGVAVDSER